MLDYQALSDDIRERLDADEQLTQDELRAFEQQLEEKMPVSIQSVLGRDEPGQALEQAARPDFDLEALRPKIVSEAPGMGV